MSIAHRSRFVALGALAVFALLAAASAPAAAQGLSGTDIIIGSVRGDDGAPVQDATVEAYSLETQVVRRAHTDAKGRFTILFPDGGGQYRMTARVLGMTPHTSLLVRDADEDRLVWNVQLSAGAVALEAVDVRTGPQLRAGEGPTPGSTERAFSPDQLSQMPIDVTDLSVLAGLVPGVLPISSTDTTATAFSVAGLGADANAVTLDGLLFGNSAVPQEGLRSTRVVTSTYDVSRGSFSGGLVASTTRSGSNFVAGSSQYQLRDEGLSVDAGDTPYTQGFNQNVISGGLGGALIHNRLFLMVSGQARLRSDPQQTLLSAGPTDFTRLGVAPDSVARFKSILSGLGVPYNSVSGLETRASDAYSGLARMDLVLSTSHTITLRGDWRGTSLDPARLGALALPQTGGKNLSSGGGVMLTFTSHFGATVLNELRGYLQGSKNNSNPFTQIPGARVQVASALPDTTLGVTTLTFGGNTGMPSSSHSSSFEGTDEMSWLPGSGMHRIKIGASLLTERTNSLLGNDLLGTYTYNSLANLQAGLPAQFQRTLDVTARQSDDLRWSMYAGDVWFVTRPFQLTYGVRLEGNSFGDTPAYNPTVDTAFGHRTDHLPSEWHLSPRAGFTWTIGGQQAGGFGGGGGGGGGGFAGGGFRGFQPAKWVIRAGAGEFRSQPATNLVAQARSATGLPSSASQIDCIGAGVPTPNWGAYWLSPDSIAQQCGNGGPPPAGFQAARSVMVLAPNFEAPRAWRGSLSVERRLTTLLRLTVEGSLARGVAQTGYSDLNLVSQPAFFLGDEHGRPVYEDPGAIVPTTGATSLSASRFDPVFGRVLLASSNLQSKQEQLTVSLGGVFGRAIQVQASYAFQRAWDQQSGEGPRGSTAGDPNVVQWATSDMERRHSFLLTLTYPLSNALELTSIGRLTSGAPFTPMVSGDVNGDGSRNDRAFIFAPSTAPGASAEALGMAQLLAGASSSVRACLQAQEGTVAARNTCTGPWQATLDFQLNWRPTFFGLNRRLQVSVLTYNFLRGLDELLHGTNGALGWGLQTQPDNTLLYVTGFDPSTQQYHYTVNGRFGATYGSATAYRPPFQVGIQMRITLGPDRVRQALDAMRSGGGGGRGGYGGEGGGFGGMGGMVQSGGFRGPVTNAMELVSRIDSALPNPAAVVLGMKDSLQLDSGQVVLLAILRDSLVRRNGVVMDSLRSIAQSAGRNADATTLMTLMPRLRPLFEKMRNEVAQDIVSVHAILHEDQWAKVPDSVKNFRMGGLRGGPGAGGPPRDRPPQ